MNPTIFYSLQFDVLTSILYRVQLEWRVIPETR